MGQPDLIIDGHRLSTIMPWGDLELVKCWPGGTETITFDVARSHSMFRPGTLVELDHAGERKAVGQLREHSRGEPLVAEGLHRLGEDYAGLDAGGSLPLATSVHNAVDTAVTRGLPWFRGPDGAAPYDLSPEPLVRGLPRFDGVQPHSVAQYLDQSALERGHLWGVRADRYVLMQDWSEPEMYLLPGVDGLGRNPSGYASVLIARYNDSTSGVYKTAAAEDFTASGRWGRVERTLPQLLGEGVPMTEVQAAGILQGILNQGLVQMGWDKPIEVQYGDVVNAFNQPVDLWDLGAPAQTVELLGLVEDMADLNGGTTARLRIARTRHRDSSVLIEPLGLSSPMEEALAKAGAA